MNIFYTKIFDYRHFSFGLSRICGIRTVLTGSFWVWIDPNYVAQEKKSQSFRRKSLFLASYFSKGLVVNSVFFYVFQDNAIKLNNGESISGKAKWLLGYPLKNHTHMAIQITMDPDSIYQGVFNFDPTSLYQPICQKSLGRRHRRISRPITSYNSRTRL